MKKRMTTEKMYLELLKRFDETSEHIDRLNRNNLVDTRRIAALESTGLPEYKHEENIKEIRLLSIRIRRLEQVMTEFLHLLRIPDLLNLAEKKEE